MFRKLGLSAPIVKALKEQGYETPTPIQTKAIPPALAGRDVLGCAQTGTGKTCAFAAPILQRLSAAPAAGHPIRALILTPTRELAIQIDENFRAYGAHLPLRCAVIFGGVGQNPQVEQLKRGVDVLTATPGRLGDLYQQGLLDLSHIEIFVLDEADRMLDMGFIHDVRKILKWLPEKKQTMLFSATMPPEITQLVNSLLHDPVRVAVNPVSSPVEAITQSVYAVDKANKTRLLAHLVREKGVKNALVFTRTKHGANKVARDLGREGISAAAIHGNKSQTARQQALADFKAGRVQCLVATDIAARGLDIEELSHVFNYNLPEVPETYVHRIGRTGRAGRGGEAIAFCDFAEQSLLRDIEKLLRRTVPLVEDHPFPMQVFEAPKRDKHGKIINEEDAEARAAARELRAQRAQLKAVPTPEAAAEEAPADQPKAKKRRRKKAKAQEVTEARPVPAAPEAEEEPLPYDPLPSRPARPLRPGVLLDTGDAMPRTEFYRPNPLDSDVIMDATARLLAPRTLTLQSKSSPGPRREEAFSGKNKPAGKKKPAKPQAPVPVPAESAAEKKPRRKKKKAAAPAAAPAPAPQPPAQPPKAEKKPRRKKRSGGAVEAPRSGGHKDSTQQESLMKPFYLTPGK